MLPDNAVHFLPITTKAAISATTTLTGPAIPTGFNSTTLNGEVSAAYILDTTAITGDNTNRYDIQLCKGTKAAPVNIAFLRFITGTDLADSVAKAFTLNDAADSGSTTINEGATFTATDTTLTITSAASFPASGKYWIKVDSEIMQVTAGAGTTSWTVTRGQAGTKASSHADGATVQMWITSDARRLTSGDQLHVICTKGGTASNLSANFTVWVCVANNYLYAGQDYAQ